MSLELPANVLIEVERYAQSERISVVEAATKLIQDGLTSKARKRNTPKNSEEQLKKLREIPTVVFFEGLSEATIEGMERASRQIKSERLNLRG